MYNKLSPNFSSKEKNLFLKNYIKAQDKHSRANYKDSFYGYLRGSCQNNWANVPEWKSGDFENGVGGFDADEFFEIALKHAKFVLENGSLANPQTYKNVVMELHRKINAIDPSHEVPAVAPQAGNEQSSGGCYVATAVYGSYECPEVWTLRRYRDYTLAETWYGRTFVKIYYAVSPTLVKWFGQTKWFKNMWKGKLDRMVENLQKQGVKSSPYEDRVW